MTLQTLKVTVIGLSMTKSFTQEIPHAHYDVDGDNVKLV